MEINPLLVEFDKRMYSLACAEFSAEIQSGFQRLAKINDSQVFLSRAILRAISEPQLNQLSQCLPKRVRRNLLDDQPGFYSEVDKVLVEFFLNKFSSCWI